MKLLFCPDCGDVTQMMRTFRSCRCKAVEGRYIDDEIVEVTGERAEVIGLDGFTLRGALSLVDANDKRGPDLRAWLFQLGSDRVRRLGRKRMAS